MTAEKSVHNEVLTSEYQLRVRLNGLVRFIQKNLNCLLWGFENHLDNHYARPKDNVSHFN